MKIIAAAVTPIVFADPPLLNSSGVHEPLAHRIVVRLEVADGTYGYGECSGGAAQLRKLQRAAELVIGLEIHETSRLESIIAAAMAAEPGGASLSIVSPFEVAALDIQGKLAGVPVVDLLGGKVRDRVPFSAYLFYKWAEHPAVADRPAIGDEWGEALDPDGIVGQARRMVEMYGFGSMKLKGGVWPPDRELEALQALHAAFPDAPLRLDPNGAWTVETSKWVARQAEGLLEYLEDPTMGQFGMAEVAKEATMPLATNMCVVRLDQIRPAVELGAVHIVLGDHHYWGGLRRTRDLAATCAAFGLGMSMHSNSHLGVSLAAMVHVAAATPILTYACDTHYPWNADHDIVTDPLPFVDGSIAVPSAPGLGVDVDLDKLGSLHEQYLASASVNRDDTGYMRRFFPEFDARRPRW